MILSEKIYKLSDTENGFLSLKNHDLFARLTEEEYQELDLANSVMEAKKGAYIYFESQYLNKLFFIKEGCIKIGYIDNSGNEIVKEILQQGEVFGQFSLQRNNMNGEFAQAHKCDVTLCAFTIDNFRKLLQQNTSIAVGYSQKVGNRLRKIENRLVNMLHVDVRTRLVRFLYDMAQTQELSISENSVTLNNFLTHDDIAHLIGSTRQTVTMVFNEPEIKQLVNVSRKYIVLPDIRAIHKMAAY